jgi:molybdenum cofactor guanylyltransferase
MPTPDSQQVTAVILAGGQGKRLQGQDKGLIVYNQQPIVETILQCIKPFTSQILINANRNIETYVKYGYPVIMDELSGYQGPLAGIASALQQAKTSHILVMPCDGPFITSNYITRMCQHLEQKNSPLAVAHDGQRLQPIHALISTELQCDIECFLHSGKRGVKHWYTQHSFTQVDFSDMPEIFTNINTAEQLNT